MSTSQINPNQLRSAGDDGSGPIVRIGPERRAEAIERLVTAGHNPDRDHARRFIEYAVSHRINLEGLWSRLDRRGRVMQTALAVPSPGRTAMVFASHVTNAVEIPLLAGLIDHTCGDLARSDVNLAQALLDPGERLDQDAFRSGGFFDLAVLSYLERSLPSHRASRPQSPQWPSGVVPVTYADSMRGELLDVLQQSYEETLDCPGLRGYRTVEDILEGHRASGLFDRTLWAILRVEGAPAGALLLNPSSDHHSIELVYVGLIKRCRGRGLGTQLLRHGLLLIDGRRERTLTLAVDELNAPALSLYQREGFRPALRRTALIRPLKSESATSAAATDV